MKIYAIKNFLEYTIELDDICIKPNSLGKYKKYIIYHNTYNRYKIVNANDLIKIYDSEKITLN